MGLIGQRMLFIRYHCISQYTGVQMQDAFVLLPKVGSTKSLVEKVHTVRRLFLCSSLWSQIVTCISGLDEDINESWQCFFKNRVRSMLKSNSWLSFLRWYHWVVVLAGTKVDSGILAPMLEESGRWLKYSVCKRFGWSVKSRCSHEAEKLFCPVHGPLVISKEVCLILIIGKVLLLSQPHVSSSNLLESHLSFFYPLRVLVWMPASIQGNVTSCANRQLRLALVLLLLQGELAYLNRAAAKFLYGCSTR